MKKILEQIHKLALQTITETSKKNFKGITDEDVDKLAEAIELFNDVYEELYNKVFEDSENICKGTSDQL